MLGRARRHAEAALRRNVEVLERVGYRAVSRSGLVAELESDAGPGIRLRMDQQGRIFGGAYALELSTAEPVLPATEGLRGRPRGVVKLGGVSFRAHKGDRVGTQLAQALDESEALQAAIGRVHFDRVRIEPDGRAVIRHMGGSLVWVLFPPLVRPVPLVEAQARLTVRALDAFAAAASACGA